MSRGNEPGVSVTAVTADDWPMLRELRLAALADAPEAFWATFEDEARYAEDEWRRWHAAAHWLVARDQSGPVGLCAVLTRADQPEPELISMWVLPAARRRGVAGSLLDRACADVAATGAPSLVLWVVEGNDAAAALYRRAGFEPTGERVPLPRGDRDEALFRRRLRPDVAGGQQ